MKMQTSGPGGRLYLMAMTAAGAALLGTTAAALALPDYLLPKAGKRSKMELQKVKAHPTVATDILANVRFPYPVLPAIRHHHERWDGSGYPDGLKGEEIPLVARVLAVADAFEALTSDRAWRGAKSHQEACALIETWSGTQFDPALVNVLRQGLDAIVEAASRVPEHTHAWAHAEQGSGDDPLPSLDALGLWNGSPTPGEDAGGVGDSLHQGVSAEGTRGAPAGPDHAGDRPPGAPP